VKSPPGMGDETHRGALAKGYSIQWYEIREILGQGGFGITYLARDTNLEHLVAIKEYLPGGLAVRDEDSIVQPMSGKHGEQYQWGLSRFIDEARTLARFKHANIVRVLSVFEANNTAYMVMEYERGQSLQARLANRGTLDETALLQIVLPLLSGLQQVHAAGFIHRDIKPDNIFIREDGSPLLLDFGSARQASGQRTNTLTAPVSPGYAPFEQYYSKSDEQGPWTDIYGLAVTMYRAICGRAPTDAVDRSRTILESNEDFLVSATEIGRGTYSASLLRAIDHGLAFRAGDRPRDIVSWQQDFDLDAQLTQGQPGQSNRQVPTVLAHRADAQTERASTTDLPATSPAGQAGNRRVGWLVAALVIAVAALVIALDLAPFALPTAPAPAIHALPAPAPASVQEPALPPQSSALLDARPAVLATPAIRKIDEQVSALLRLAATGSRQ
jgi:serine/threonine protein kinase